MSGTVTYKRRTEHTWEYRFPVEESPWPEQVKRHTSKRFKPTRLVVRGVSRDDGPVEHLGVTIYGLRIIKSGYGAVESDHLLFREEWPDFVVTIVNVIEASL